MRRAPCCGRRDLAVLSARERARRSVRRGGMASVVNGGARARRRILCRRAVCIASLQRSAAKCSEVPRVDSCGAAVAVARIRRGGDCVATNERLLGVGRQPPPPLGAVRAATPRALPYCRLVPRGTRLWRSRRSPVRREPPPWPPHTSHFPNPFHPIVAVGMFTGVEIPRARGPRRQLCRSIYVSIAGCCAVARRASRPRHRRCPIHIRPIPSAMSTNPSSCTPRKASPRSSCPENADRNVRGVSRTLHPLRRGYTPCST